MRLNSIKFLLLLILPFVGYTQVNTISWPETFENNSKHSYSLDTLNLSTGSWTVYDALIGSSANDIKNGNKSLRIQHQGFITMNYDIVGSPNQLSFKHATYGNDAPAVFAIYSSIDSGKTWIKYKKDIHSNTNYLSNCIIKIGHQKPIRFQIRKISGGRLNIDDINITNSTNTIVYNYKKPANLNTPQSGTVTTVCVCNSDTIPTRDDNMAMGNPSNASTANTDSNNYLMSKTQYSLSYNNSKGTANWVSWHLSKAWKGSAARCNCFTQDADLPTGYFKASTSQYTNTGFDRGHLCPSDDRDSLDADNRATFLMSNIAPQAPILNQQTWGDLEDYSRKLITQGYELYIIAGGYGSGGTGTNGTATSINSGKINVYAHYWKIIVVLPVGSNDLTRVSTSTRVIAVDMPNNQTVNANNWGYYRVSVDAIEAATGYNFLSNVLSTIQNTIEASVDTGATN